MSFSSDNYVKLISSEGHEFIILKDVARVSSTLRTMIDSSFSESKGEIKLQEITSAILEKVIQYLYYRVKYTSSTTERVPAFEVSQEMSLELLMAANYLDC